MRVLRAIGAGAGVLAVVVLVVLAAKVIGDRIRTDRQQDALDPFYTPPEPLPSAQPGTIIRSEALGTPLEGAQTHRFLYVTQTSSGAPTVSSGMILIPSSAPPPGGRKIVAWAHPTVGLGDACAPSRTASPIKGQLTEPWMLQMVKFGWVVVATDYAGLGTPGTSQYLVGKSEAYDVINSVRAARSFPGAEAGTTWAVYGHSQGGHSALWTGVLAKQYAPELNLVAVTAAAPAAELGALVTEQWDKDVSWVIGPEVTYAWPTVTPGLPIEGVVSAAGQRNTDNMAKECVMDAAVEGGVRQKIGERYYSMNPNNNPRWSEALAVETPPPITDLPVLVVQGTGDNVVIPNTTALLNQRWCQAGSDLSLVWLGGQDHTSAGQHGGTIAGQWIHDVFDGKKPGSTCGVPPTIDPSPVPVPSGE